MNLTPVVICLFTTFTTILAIQVPTAWPKHHEQKQFLYQNRNSNQIRPPSSNSETFLNKQTKQNYHYQPYVPQKYNKINKIKNSPLHQRHPNLKKREETVNDWIPILPKYQNDLPVTKLANLRQKPLSSFTRRNYKNYRDDTTHEEEFKNENLEFPTRVNYPGEGEWAKQGTKHQVFIPIHRFAKIHHEKEETTDQPEGIEIFEKNKQLFDKNSEQVFLPAKENLEEKLHASENSEEADPEEEEEEDESAEFVPMQLYTQVRRSENEQHFPASAAEDERLKEIVRDSKIQTVYTEEGYEDAGYDHAGHEKLAEEDEGQAEFDKNIDTKNENDSEEEPSFQEDSASAGSEYKKLLPNKKVNIKTDKNNFIKTEETKTTAVKDAGGGNSEMEISSQIRILAAPNNSSKTHKYVKIFPKIYRYDRIQEETHTEAPNPRKSKKIKLETPDEGSALPQAETSTPSIVAHIPELEFPAEIEETSSENIELAKIVEVTPETTGNHPETSESGSTSASTVTQPKRELDAEETTPLETISSITKAFYKIDKKRFKRSTKYPYYSNKEINKDSPLRYSEDLETIPLKRDNEMAFYNQADRLECAEVETDIDPVPNHVKNEEESDESSEKIVKGPRLGRLGDKIDCFKKKYFGENPLDSPIFTEVTVSPVVPVLNFATTRKNEIKVNEIQSDKKIKEETSSIVENKTESSVTIITTPKYTIDLQPKHIYDQIELLHYLPGPSSLLENASTPESGNRTGKSVEEAAEATESTSPESAALRKRRRRVRPPVMSQFMTPPARQAQFPLFPFTTTSTTTPKENLISEVHYKNEIKPIEQLNVFSDIINNIKNSTKESLSLSTSSDRIAVKLNTFGNNNHYYPYNAKTIHVKNSEVSALDNIEETNSFYLSTTTPPPPIEKKFKTHRENYEELVNEQELELFKVGQPGKSSTTSKYEEETSEVLGMMPPGLDRYKTIYTLPEPEVTVKHFVPSPEAKPVLHEKKMNNFFYIGMKPPPSKQKIILYSDFKSSLNPKRKFISRRRSRRSAQKPVYSSVIRNRNKPIDAQDDEETKPIIVADEDDYVPHRPKNYHYDEKTGRIVYDKKEEKPDEEEEVVYVEVTEAPVPKPTRRNNQKNKKEEVKPAPKFSEATGPSFVEFVKKLKSNPKYEAIPDPTTTEKSEETTIITSTLKPISTTPPEFLGILAKVRSNSNYKQIEDKKSTTTTTEASPQEEETQVQNAPGGQSITSTDQNFQIFDISEYLPKVKTYSPRTSIDYSKYKTIERPNLRHNLSSRYNSEEEELGDVRTSRVPVILKDEEMSESKVEEMVPVTSTTQVPSSTTLRRLRTRVRSTRRPVTTTTSSSLSVALEDRKEEEEEEVGRHEKPKRTYPRRRPGRIRISSKIPEEKPKEKEVEETPEKIVRRRQVSSKIIQKRMDTVSVNSSSSTNRIDPRRRRIIKKRTNSGEAQNIPSRINPRRIDQVEVFNSNLDQDKKHGGNYRKEINDEKRNPKDKAPATANQSETKHVKQVQRLTDVVPKPEKFYTDEKLPENVNRLKEIEKDDEEEEEEEIDEEGRVHDEVLDYDENVEEELDEAYPQPREKVEVVTKKPFFVKDPSKRLYYYAPV